MPRVRNELLAVIGNHEVVWLLPECFYFRRLALCWNGAARHSGPALGVKVMQPFQKYRHQGPGMLHCYAGRNVWLMWISGLIRWQMLRKWQLISQGQV